MKILTGIIISAICIAVLVGAVVAGVLAKESYHDGHVGAAITFTCLLMIVSVAWLFGLFGYVWPALLSVERIGGKKDRITELGIPCPKCGKNLANIEVGKGISMDCCVNKECAEFGKSKTFQVI